MDLRARVDGADRRVPAVVGPGGRRAHNHDLVLERVARDLPGQDVADGHVREGLCRTEIVDEQPAALVGGDGCPAELEPVHPVPTYVYHEQRRVQVVPGRHDGKRREELLSPLNDERHPADDAVFVVPEAEVPGAIGGLGEYPETTLRSVRLWKRRELHLRILVHDERVLGCVDALRERFVVPAAGLRRQEADVEGDHLRAVCGQLVHQSRHPGAWPGPASFAIQALLVHHGQDHSWRGLLDAA